MSWGVSSEETLVDFGKLTEIVESDDPFIGNLVADHPIIPDDKNVGGGIGRPKEIEDVVAVSGKLLSAMFEKVDNCIFESLESL